MWYNSCQLACLYLIVYLRKLILLSSTHRCDAFAVTNEYYDTNLQSIPYDRPEASTIKGLSNGFRPLSLHLCDSFVSKFRLNEYSPTSFVLSSIRTTMVLLLRKYTEERRWTFFHLKWRHTSTIAFIPMTLLKAFLVNKQRHNQMITNCLILYAIIRSFFIPCKIQESN